MPLPPKYTPRTREQKHRNVLDANRKTGKAKRMGKKSAAARARNGCPKPVPKLHAPPPVGAEKPRQEPDSANSPLSYAADCPCHLKGLTDRQIAKLHIDFCKLVYSDIAKELLTIYAYARFGAVLLLFLTALFQTWGMPSPVFGKRFVAAQLMNVALPVDMPSALTIHTKMRKWKKDH